MLGPRIGAQQCYHVHIGLCVRFRSQRIRLDKLLDASKPLACAPHLPRAWTQVYVCAPEVLALFQDNFDYQVPATTPPTLDRDACA